MKTIYSLLTVCICMAFSQSTFHFDREIVFQMSDEESPEKPLNLTILLSTSDETFSAMSIEGGLMIKSSEKHVMIRGSKAMVMPAVKNGLMDDFEDTDDETIVSFKKTGKTKSIAGVLSHEYEAVSSKGNKGYMWIGKPPFKIYGQLAELMGKIKNTIPNFPEKMGVIMETNAEDGSLFRVVSISNIKKTYKLSDYDVQDLTKMSGMKELINNFSE